MPASPQTHPDTDPLATRDTGHPEGTHPVVTINRMLGRVETAMLVISCILIGAMLVMVATDAVSRYLFNAPLRFTYDVVTMYLMPGAMFFAISHTLRLGGHVNVDLFIDVMPARLSRTLLGLGLLATVPIALVIAYRVGILAHESYVTGDAAVGLYRWPHWISEIIVPVTFGMLALRMTLLGVANLMAAVGQDPRLVAVISPSRIDISEEAVE